MAQNLWRAVDKVVKWREEEYLNLNASKYKTTFFSLAIQESTGRPTNTNGGVWLSSKPHPVFLGVKYDKRFITFQTFLWTIGVGLRMSTLDSNVAGSIPASICFSP